MLHEKTALFKLLAFLLLIFYCFTIFFHKDSALTQDLGRHLLLGNLIIKEKKVPQVNLLSYTYPDHPFINHHWLSGVFFAFMDDFSGISGLIIIKTTIAMTTFSILSIYAFKKHNCLAVLISGTIALELMRERTEIRPEIFGLFLTAVLLLILYLNLDRKKEHGKSLYFFPFICFLYVNLHISFIYAFVLFIFYLFHKVVYKTINRRDVIIGLSGLVASLVNPAFINGVLYPLRILKTYGYPIAENQNPFFLDAYFQGYPTAVYFKIALVLNLGLSLVFLVRKKNLFQILSLWFFTAVSLHAVRNFSFLGLILYIPFSSALSYLFGLNIIRKFGVSKIRLLMILPAVFLFAFIILRSTSLITNNYYFENKSSLRFGLGFTDGMKGSLDFFSKQELHGPVFNNFNIGSYIAYRLYPSERVFVDGRPEAYPADFFSKVYIPMQENNRIFQKESEKYSFKTIIFSYDDATPWARSFLKSIIEDRLWKLVYYDFNGVVFAREDQNQPIETSRDFLKSNGLEILLSAKEQDQALRLAYLFNLWEEEILEKRALERASFLRAGSGG